MADNVGLPLTGSGADSTATVASDEIGGVHYQRVKLALGADGAAADAAVGGGVESGALRVTVASDSTGVLSVDDNGASLTVDNAHLTSLGGAISGTEVQVDVVGALPAGTNAIGKLAANSGVDIGDVDVTSVVPGTGATNLGKAEDAAHTTGDVGVMALAVRLDSGASLAGTDGDYTPLQVDSAGALRVTGGGGGTQYTEGDTDASITGTAMLMEGAGNALVAAQGTASDGLLVNLGGNNDVTLGAAIPAGTNNIGDVDVASVPAPLSTTGGGTEATALRVTVATDSTGVLSVDDNGGSLTVDGTVALSAVVPGTGATNLGKAEDAVHSSGDVGVMVLGVRQDTPSALAADGDYIPLSMDSNGAARVTPIGGTIDTVDTVSEVGVVNGVVPGTGATSLGKAEDAAHSSGDVGVMALSVRQDTAAALGGTDADYQPLITDASGRLHVNASGGVGGTVAHDAADSGNPVKVGGKARTTNPTAVADADRVDATFDDIGRQVVVLNQVRDLVVHQHTQIASSSSETTIVTAGAAGVFHDLTHLIVTNQTATAVNVTIKDATAGTTRMIIALAANGGAVIPFSVPVPQASAANNWTATLSSASVTVNIFAQAVKNV